MAAAGAELGLDKDAAEALARQTLMGAGALLKTDPRSVGELRQAVTSPGGTTAAAIESYESENGRLRALVREAMRAAAARAEALSE